MARLPNLQQTFEGNRYEGIVTVEDDVVTAKLDRKSFGPSILGFFITAIEPDSGERVGRFISSTLVVRRGADAKIDLDPLLFPVEFGDQEFAILSFGPTGIRARKEFGSDFAGDDMILTSWQLSKITSPRGAAFRLPHGAASTARGGINPFLLTRRF